LGKRVAHYVVLCSSAKSAREKFDCRSDETIRRAHLVADKLSRKAHAERLSMTRMTVEGICIDPQNNPLILLRDELNTTYVAIWVGASEAVSIQTELDGRPMLRPMTHDLLAQTLQELGASLVKVTVNDFDRSVFYA